MKISLLKKRENFEQVLMSSLARFFRNQYSWEGSISVSRLEAGDFYVNDRLNVIYPKAIDRCLLEPLVKEFVYNPSLFRHIIQKIYVAISVSKYMDFAFKSSSLRITNSFDLPTHMVFIPGNHAIRGVDLFQDCCFVFVKEGFDARFLETDAKVRLEHTYLKAPKILDFNFDQGWYKEERVEGIPLNRIADLRLREMYRNLAFAELRELYKQTALVSKLSAHVNTMFLMIKSGAEQLSDVELRASILNLSESLCSGLLRIPDVDINLVLSHGDFQPANLLCSDDVWLIDWEYALPRSIFYDGIVFSFQGRLLSGLSERLSSISKSLEDGDCLFEWTGFTLNCSNKFYIQVFLLEEIALRVTEAACLNPSGQILSLVSWVVEYERYMESLVEA